MAVLSRIMLVLAIIGVPASVQTLDWPRFRGASDGVVADHPDLPEHWSTTDNIAWRVDIPGRGWSSPVVWDDHVFVFTAINVEKPIETFRPVTEYIGRSIGGTMTGDDVSKNATLHRWVVLDIEAQTGRARWQRELRSAVPAQPLHQKNSFASETPVTDGKRVYVYSSYAGFYAIDFHGAIVWSTPMDAAPMRQGWGGAASPALHDGRLYVVSDNETASFLAAYDARTGRELWRTPRTEKSSWSTPYVWQNSLRTEIVTTATEGISSYDTAGRLLWQLKGLTTTHATTPVAAGDLLYVGSGFQSDPVRPVYVIRPGATGDLSLEAGRRSDYVAWSHPTLAASYPSALLTGDIYYVLLDRGFMTATHAHTGEPIYGRQRIATDGGMFSASPWAYNGKVFALNEDGTTYVIQAGRGFKVLGQNPLDEFTLATPAIAHNSLFIRTATKLYRIGARKR